MAITKISVRGARQHNLKNIDVEIPRNTLSVITGLSGSGKSSLAFDTIYAEGQRRYVETLSAYARQFLDQMERPDVDAIDGLSPSISIEQKTTSRSPRSTVGTITEIYDYLRLLFASIGVPHCPNCGRPITRQSAEQIVQRVMALTPEDRVMVMAPIVRGRKGEFKKEMEKLVQHGFARARIDGELVNLEDEIQLDKRKNHTIEVVIDRLLVKPGIESRLELSVGLAMKLAGGLVQIAVVGGEETLYSSRLACPDCGINVPQLEPRSFSFNSAYGACPECHGLGSKYDFDPAKIITDWSKPLLDGGLGPGSASQNLLNQVRLVAEAYGINLATPFEKLPDKIQTLLLYGEPERGGKTGYRGILSYLKKNLEETASDNYRDYMMDFMSATLCSVCRGKRLRPESLAVKVNGMSIADFTSLPVSRSFEVARKIKLAGREEAIAGRIMHEIVERLQFLHAVGLGYISLDRSAATLSGGEGQRIRLATQIGSKLRGVLYVLDEPSIGLHPRDNNRLLLDTRSSCAISATRCSWSNTMKRRFGAPTTSLTLAQAQALTAASSSRVARRDEITQLPTRSPGTTFRRAADRHARRAPAQANGKAITMLGARETILKNIDVDFPAGRVDGRDWSVGIRQIDAGGRHSLSRLARQLYRSLEEPGAHKTIRGCGPHRQSDRDRSVADRPHAAIESGDLHRTVHADSRALCDAARIARARL